ncbi:MAG: sugar phosphate nucleotidyltransferase [Bacteroidota bacterium]
MKKYQAVILAGGKGRRLHPFTTTIPKPLFPLNEKAIIQIIIEQLKHYGFSRILISVGYLSELVKAYLGSGNRFGVEIEYVQELEPLGTAGPLTLVTDYVEDNFIYMNGDILSDINFKKAYLFHIKRKADLTICTFEKKIQSTLGVLQYNKNGKIKDYIEKPIHTFSVSSGIYVIKKETLKMLKTNCKIDLPLLVKKCIKLKKELVSYPIKGNWFDIGTAADLEKAENFISNK